MTIQQSYFLSILAAHTPAFLRTVDPQLAASAILLAAVLSLIAVTGLDSAFLLPEKFEAFAFPLFQKQSVCFQFFGLAHLCEVAAVCALAALSAVVAS